MKKPTTPLKAGQRPILSILTATVPSRRVLRVPLEQEIEAQIEQNKAERLVEHLIFSDNWNRRIGEKRTDLLRLARGEYVIFLDDDDHIAPEYIERLLDMADTGADVLTFRQSVQFKGQLGEVAFRLGARDEPFKPISDGIINRGPWHVCGWKRELVKNCVFPFINYGEDAAWSAQARRMVKTEAHLPQVLHEYRHDESLSEAPALT